MRISQLEGKRVALWGWGREGRAAYRAINTRLPALPLTLLCTTEEAGDARALQDAALSIETDASAESLAAFDVVIKSPGISAYKPEVFAARDHGTRFIGGTTLWFAEHPQARTVCVTGTKGKSTTSALVAHLLRAGGYRTALAGNIGLPLLELIDDEAEFWVIELSSYQTGDVADSGVRPEVAVALNIFPEHLDWHGSEQRYVEDKLALITRAHPRTTVLNANDKILRSFGGASDGRDHVPEKSIASMLQRGMTRSCKGDVTWFNRDDGWHLRGDALYHGGQEVMDSAMLPLSGRHNRINLCAALAAIEALGLDAVALAPHAASFQPLPHRLQRLGERDDVAYINDSISTTPHASLAALETCREQRTVLLVGGHDRGVDWSAFAEAMRSRAPVGIVTMGQNGPRIHALLASGASAGSFKLDAAPDLADAIARARTLLGDSGGVILLSPGAPSFGAYRDYTQRGRHFATLAGFDADAGSIHGMGIA